MSFNPFANKADLEAAQSQISSLTEDLTAAQAELTAERGIVATHAQTISDLQSQVANLTAERDNATQVLTQAQEQIETLQASVKTAEASAEQKAVQLLAENGHDSPINLDSQENNQPKEELRGLKKVSAFFANTQKSKIN